VSGLAPRALGDSVRPRRYSGASVRPLNFTVRRAMWGRRSDFSLSRAPWQRLL